MKTDEWRTIKVSNNKILVDGFFRTDIDPHFIGNDLREPKACPTLSPCRGLMQGMAVPPTRTRLKESARKIRFGGRTNIVPRLASTSVWAMKLVFDTASLSHIGS